MNNRVKQWLLGPDRGLSSEQIVETMEGLPPGLLTGHHYGAHPWDNSDFYRCYMLLQIAPEYRARLAEMSNISPQWKALVENWTELEHMLEEEIRTGNGSALYARLEQLIRGCRNEQTN